MRLTGIHVFVKSFHLGTDFSFHIFPLIFFCLQILNVILLRYFMNVDCTIYNLISLTYGEEKIPERSLCSNENNQIWKAITSLIFVIWYWRLEPGDALKDWPDHLFYPGYHLCIYALRAKSTAWIHATLK